MKITGDYKVSLSCRLKMKIITFIFLLCTVTTVLGEEVVKDVFNSDRLIYPGPCHTEFSEEQPYQQPEPTKKTDVDARKDQKSNTEPEEEEYAGTLSEVNFQDYTIRTYRQSGYSQGQTEFAFEIRKKGEIIYEKKEDYYSQYSIMIADPKIDVDMPDISIVTLGKDINNDGSPNAVVLEYGGRLMKFHIFEIGPHFSYIGSLDKRDVESGPSFLDMDNDGSLEFVTVDILPIFDYLGTQTYPYPKIIFKYQNGHYDLSPELMYRPAPSINELTAQAQNIRAAYLQKTAELQWGKGNKKEYVCVEPPYQLWDKMVDLVYSGHADLAHQFFDLSWPPEIPGKDNWQKEFDKSLAEHNF